jgi:hypothetical protein
MRRKVEVRMAFVVQKGCRREGDGRKVERIERAGDDARSSNGNSELAT